MLVIVVLKLVTRVKQKFRAAKLKFKPKLVSINATKFRLYKHFLTKISQKRLF